MPPSSPPVVVVPPSLGGVGVVVPPSLSVVVPPSSPVVGVVGVVDPLPPVADGSGVPVVTGGLELFFEELQAQRANAKTTAEQRAASLRTMGLLAEQLRCHM